MGHEESEFHFAAVAVQVLCDLQHPPSADEAAPGKKPAPGQYCKNGGIVLLVVVLYKPSENLCLVIRTSVVHYEPFQWPRWCRCDFV